MGTENQDLLKQRMDEHTARMSDKLADQLYNSAVLRAVDIIALEAMKLEIPNWQDMKIMELRNEIKIRQDAMKAKVAP